MTTEHTTARPPGAMLRSDPAVIVVQHTLRPPDGRTKYVDQMVSGASPYVAIRFFSWRNALFGSYDVFHVHWPELMIRGRGRTRRFFKRRAMELLILRLRMRRIPLVRTLHNVVPHEQGSAAERRSLARFDRAVDLYIRLNPTTELPTPAAAVTIPHGHYVDRFADHRLPPTEPGRVLYFGIIREYKGVDGLLDAFRQLDDDTLTLRIVGSPSIGQRELVERRCAQDHRASARLRYVDDSELVDEIGRAELVVLPYREMHNSGSILVALSLSRPVLVPRSAANSALVAEVGPGWIIEYDGRLSPTHIANALTQVRSRTPDAAIDLSHRDWNLLGEQHRHAYEQAISRLRGAR